ncbi:formate dehydrogenase accessory sulfurtransferase FdhD [Methanospirillum lacunae]|uniref:Sulfur carrier protein FdhD n=1 Tax=Methanospirillum lacunae TaxID=668570 RepID=A0A2V2MT31_9EURY|nr:formate dehydrogenase accessory sulfurtransferase FdhD [Methanospirillum lacunae]PWR71354.1 formate dehydrogenase accessory sulfurtransferase FdhD [Methanospirillum lacunae]
MTEELSITVPCIKEIDHAFSTSNHEVVIEAPYALWVNGRQILNVMTSPSRLEDFVVGYLYTEGMIKQVDDIESLQIEKQTIRVLTTGKVAIREGKKTILSGCGGDSSFLDINKLPLITSDVRMDPVWIHQALKLVLDSDLHIRTGGIHVVGLVSSNTMITKTEDIGRHNALDRVIGYALRTNWDLTRTCVLISGRISSEMSRKCILAGIPMIASRGATTSLAIEMAQATGLTIIGFIRGGKMNIYTSPERIIGAKSSIIE